MGGVTDKPEKGLVWVISSTPPSADQWRLARPGDLEDAGVYGVVLRHPHAEWPWIAYGRGLCEIASSRDDAIHIFDTLHKRSVTRLREHLRLALSHQANQ